jgi:hypothetical protein
VEFIEKLIGTKIPVEKLGGGNAEAPSEESRADEPRRERGDRGRDRGGNRNNSRHQNRPDSRPQQRSPREQVQSQSRPRDDKSRPVPRRHEQDDGPDSFGDDIPSFLR